MFKKVIFTGLSPNMTKQDVHTALSFLLLPWKWPRLRSGSAPRQVEKWLQNYFGVSTAVTCDSGRSALYMALNAVGVEKGDEVLLQAYTCVVVTNAIRAVGGVPVYIDTDKTGNMNPLDLEKKITRKSKTLIIQHTFGRTADLDALLAIAQKHRLRTIEDCAHALGTEYKGKKVGTFADVAMLSFGTEKVISCARGGAAITNDPVIAWRLQKLQSYFKSSPFKKIIQHLLHYPIFSIGRSLYGIGLGKFILAVAKFLHIVHRIIYFREKRGEDVPGYPSLLPNSLAAILLNQLQDLDKTNAHRLEIARIYERELGLPTEADKHFIPLRYPLFTPQADVILRTTKKQGILLGDWYNSPVAPDDSTVAATQYTKGACPEAENLASTSVNLPTDIHITPADAKRICAAIGPLL